jgi:hypothetical protein
MDLSAIKWEIRKLNMLQKLNNPDVFLITIFVKTHWFFSQEDLRGA